MRCLPIASFLTWFAAPSATAGEGDADAGIAAFITVGMVGTSVVAEVSGASDLALPSCRGVVFERYDEREGRFVAVPSDPCGPLADAVWLGGRGVGTMSPVEVVGPPMPSGTRVVRAVAVVGEGCAPGLPFPLAGCSALYTFSSQPLTLPGSARR